MFGLAWIYELAICALDCDLCASNLSSVHGRADPRQNSDSWRIDPSQSLRSLAPRSAPGLSPLAWIYAPGISTLGLDLRTCNLSA